MGRTIDRFLPMGLIPFGQALRGRAACLGGYNTLVAEVLRNSVTWLMVRLRDNQSQNHIL